MAKEEADTLAPSVLSAWQSNRKLWQAQVAEYDELKKRYGESNEFVIALEKEIAKLSETRIEQPAIDQAKIAAAVKETTYKINEQIATVGMSKDELDVWKLSQEGATAAQIDFVDVMQRQLAAREAQQALKDDTD
jgi:hypothetical protein